MCTVVLRWQPGHPVRVLALRDELVGRAFDDPGTWWPSAPVVVGGRDRQAGGTWCASSVVTGATALVLNRPQRQVAAAGAPSRGVLPLLALGAGASWPSVVQREGMASFALLLADARSLTLWEHDGTSLTTVDLEPGTHMVTSGGPEDQRSARHLEAFAGTDPDDWRDLVTAGVPSADPASLLVEHPVGDRVFRTVFAQQIVSRPGRLELTWSRTPGATASWTARSWPS